MYENILLTVDLNEVSSWRKALPTAVECCRAFGAGKGNRIVGKRNVASFRIVSGINGYGLQPGLPSSTDDAASDLTTVRN